MWVCRVKPGAVAGRDFDVVVAHLKPDLAGLDSD